jgi:hypothetical protein
MNGESFLDLILEENGLVAFVDEQGDLSTLDEPWNEIALRVHGLSGKTWRPNGGQVEALYHAQKERLASAVEEAA